MLILSRTKDEKIIIGGNITVMIVDVRGDKVRLGITAPADVQVDRMEIHERKEQEKAEREDDGN